MVLPLYKDNSRQKDLMDFSEATEFVREQLKTMGIAHISQHDLESYTLDFLQLLKDRPEEYTIPEDTSSDRMSQVDITEESPRSVAMPTTHTDKVVEVSVNYIDGRPVTRKILRQGVGQLEEEQRCHSSCLSASEVERSRPLKSFIRPVFSHPHTRGIKKSDPVQRYHEFRQMWESQKPPGEKKRNTLRWHIKEQMLSQDIPFYVSTHHPVNHRYGNYVVPTDKKRQALRWEVRHQLAN